MSQNPMIQLEVSLSSFEAVHKLIEVGTMDLFKPAPAPNSEMRKYRLLSPSAGVRVSPIRLGAMSVGDQWIGIMGGKLDVKESEAYLDYF